MCLSGHYSSVYEKAQISVQRKTVLSYFPQKLFGWRQCQWLNRQNSREVPETWCRDWSQLRQLGGLNRIPFGKYWKAREERIIEIKNNRIRPSSGWDGYRHATNKSIFQALSLRIITEPCFWQNKDCVKRALKIITNKDLIWRRISSLWLRKWLPGCPCQHEGGTDKH